MKVLNRNQMAWRVAQDLPDGSVVNLGIGMPVLVSDHIPASRDIFLQSENGIIGVGPAASEAVQDRNLVDAGSRRVTLREGATVVDSITSFAMIRGGHVDITVLGAFEVASNGDLANWDSRTANKGPLVGGAMDLAVGAKSVWALMQFNTRDGAPRLLERCSLPLTAPGCVKRIYSDVAVVDVTSDGFVAREILSSMRADELRARAATEIKVSSSCKELTAPDLPV